MNKTNNFLGYFLTRSLFLGLGLSLLYNYTHKDTYLAALLGLGLGLIISYLFRYILFCKGNQTLNEFLSNSKIGLIAKIFILLTSLIILIYVLVIYKIFVSSFLLLNTPVIVILVPWVGLAYYLAIKGLNIIKRVATSLFFLSIILSLLAIISLVNNFNINNFLPILTVQPTNFLMSVIGFAGISTLPNILTLHYKDDFKNYLKIYIIACLFIILAIVSVNGVFGEKLTSVFRFPEYIVLKQLKLFNFIEKVENILSIAWAFDLFMTASMAIYSIKNLLPSKKTNLLTIIILLIIIFIINKVFAINYVNELKIYYILPYISISLVLIVIGLILILIKKKKNYVKQSSTI